MDEKTTTATAADAWAPILGMGSLIGIGAGLGLILGILLDGLIIGMSIGVALGTVAGAVAETRRKQQAADPPS